MNLQDSSLVNQPISNINLDAIEIEVLSAGRARELDSLILEKEAGDQNMPVGFSCDAKGLWYTPPPIGDKDPLSMWICSAITVVAIVRDHRNEGFGKLLEFRDVDDRLHQWVLSMSLLASDGSVYRGELLSRGLVIANGRKAHEYLNEFLLKSQPSMRGRIVHQIGWYKNNFVLPAEIIGPQEEKIILQQSSHVYPDYSVSGTVEEWKEKVSSLCCGNSRLVFSVSIAFAPPLLKLLGAEGAGIHWRGPSSRGKSVCLYVAASVWGGRDFCERWRSTTNGIEGLCMTHNDALLLLDELAQIKPEDAADSAYMIPNGSGKNRANQKGNLKNKGTWTVLFLSSGEISLDSHLQKTGARSTGGQEIRLLDIASEVGEHGVFENLHGFLSGKEFAEHLSTITREFHGASIRQFLQEVIDGGDEVIATGKKFIAEFVQKYTPLHADPQIKRAINRFAQIAFAGELAILYGIVAWPQGEATMAAARCFRDWIIARGGIDSSEKRKALSQVRLFFQNHGESRFSPDEGNDMGKTINRAGYRKPDKGQTVFLVFTEVFRSDVCKGLDPTFVAKVCIEIGWLEPDSEGKATRGERLPGSTKTTRVYKFCSRVLEDDVASGEESIFLNPERQV